jgi:hypothetical protein
MSASNIDLGVLTGWVTAQVSNGGFAGKPASLISVVVVSVVLWWAIAYITSPLKKIPGPFLAGEILWSLLVFGGIY